MLGLNLKPLPPPNFRSKSKPLILPNFPSLVTKLRKSQPKQFRISAENGDKRNNGVPTEKGDEEKVKNGGPRLNLKWMDLVLDPDPDNIVAVGLTGLLTWASVQVLWQLVVISAAILLAALKYTIVAVLLIFILITLL